MPAKLFQFLGTSTLAERWSPISWGLRSPMIPSPHRSAWGWSWPGSHRSLVAAFSGALLGYAMLLTPSCESLVQTLSSARGWGDPAPTGGEMGNALCQTQRAQTVPAAPSWSQGSDKPRAAGTHGGGQQGGSLDRDRVSCAAFLFLFQLLTRAGAKPQQTQLRAAACGEGEHGAREGEQELRGRFPALGAREALLPGPAPATDSLLASRMSQEPEHAGMAPSQPHKPPCKLRSGSPECLCQAQDGQYGPARMFGDWRAGLRAGSVRLRFAVR